MSYLYLVAHLCQRGSERPYLLRGLPLVQNLQYVPSVSEKPQRLRGDVLRMRRLAVDFLHFFRVACRQLLPSARRRPARLTETRSWQISFWERRPIVASARIRCEKWELRSPAPPTGSHRPRGRAVLHGCSWPLPAAFQHYCQDQRR